MAYQLNKLIPKNVCQKQGFFVGKKNHPFLDPYQEWTPKGAKMAPEKPRNDPQILTTPKIFDFYHQTLTLKFLYRGSTIYLIRTFLSHLKYSSHISVKKHF